MRTAENYLSSLDDGRQVYYRGRQVGNAAEHSVLKIAAMHASRLYKIENRSVMDEELGQISRYFLVPRSSADLYARHRLIYDTTMSCKGVFNISQAIGSDAIFSLYLVAAEAGEKFATPYSARVRKFHEYVTKNDLTLAVAQSDAKGDRKKRPHEQIDPDLYVHVSSIERDGIVVNGAKAHTTQAAVSDEIIVIPTRAMGEKDSDYAVAFSVPASTQGLKMIVRPIEELEGNDSAIVAKTDFELESITVFENVFVPWERVFQLKEYQLAGHLAVTFATFHRFTAVSYRAATSNLYLGAAISMAEQNGISDTAHVKDRIGEIVMYKELMRMSAVAASNSPVIKSDIAIPNPLYTNIGKLYSNKNFSNVLDALVDVSGGIISTLPSLADQSDPTVGKILAKYLAGSKDGMSRIKSIRLAKELAASSQTGYMLTLMLHAEGSIEASKMALLKDADLAEAENLITSIFADEKREVLP
jgi:4-hydroxybutyryl-CoA dehydratase / vinylacetyl-CoA-Delta-isomerase